MRRIEIFRGTRENLRLADPGADDERLVAVLRTVGLGDWLAGLPNGLDTMLGNGSAPESLSGAVSSVGLPGAAMAGGLLMAFLVFGLAWRKGIDGYREALEMLREALT